jgi:putative ABC transport system permease protein
MIRHLFKLVWHRKRANALVMIEIFFSFLVVFAVVTTAASLLVSWNRPLGFSYGNVWVISADNSGGELEQGAVDDPMRDSMARVIREAKSFPQIVDVGASDTPPYTNSQSVGVWRRNGRNVEMRRDLVTDGFSSVVGLKLLRGRWFVPEDDAVNYRPVVIDSDLASAFFGNDDPIGKKFDEDGNREDRVVGVIAPYRKDGEMSGRGVNMVFFRKSMTIPNGRVPHELLVRVRPGTPAEFELALTNRLHAVAPGLSFRVQRMDRMRELFLRFRLMPLLLGGIVALFLIAMVALGLTGVLWQTVTRRTREIGVRRALGASGIGVRRQILGEVALLATLAVIAGVAIVVQLPLIGVFAFVQPAVFVFGIFAALLVIYAITLTCGVYPAWLASRVAPSEALRYE